MAENHPQVDDQAVEYYEKAGRDLKLAARLLTPAVIASLDLLVLSPTGARQHIDKAVVKGSTMAAGGAGVSALYNLFQGFRYDPPFETGHGYHA